LFVLPLPFFLRERKIYLKSIFEVFPVNSNQHGSQNELIFFSEADGKGNVNKLTGLASNTIVEGNNLPRILGKTEKIIRGKKW